MSKYILIIGGNLFNKGAQAMTFVTVDEIKKRFPKREIILLSDIDYKHSREENSNLTFGILPVISIGVVFELLGGVYKLLWRLKAKRENKQECNANIPLLRAVLENTEMLIDISGYALSSQLSIIGVVEYLTRLGLAKKYGIKVYLMPQSFGPFSYKGMLKTIIGSMLKKYMKYPEVIYARESEGYNLLHNDYRLNNVIKSYDLVLLNKKTHISNIFKVIPELLNFKITKAVVAVIPNMRNFEHGNADKIMTLYDTAINKIIKMKKNVYLVRHSYEDIKVCKMIKERFADNDSVSIISDNMNCIELDGLIQKFEFLVASRYHSVIHAYKHGIPCIALGWATKYYELLKEFQQEQYYFDVRNNVGETAFEIAVDTMLRQHPKEKETILSVLEKIQTHNVYDVLGREP